MGAAAINSDRVKVTMELTRRDTETTDQLVQSLHSRSKAAAVSTALAVTKVVSDAISGGGEVYIKDKDGQMQKIVIAGL